MSSGPERVWVALGRDGRRPPLPRAVLPAAGPRDTAHSLSSTFCLFSTSLWPRILLQHAHHSLPQTSLPQTVTSPAVTLPPWALNSQRLGFSPTSETRKRREVLFLQNPQDALGRALPIAMCQMMTCPQLTLLLCPHAVAESSVPSSMVAPGARQWACESQLSHRLWTLVKSLLPS